MATHSSVLAWRIPWTEEPGGLPSMGRTESDTTEATWQQQQQSPVVHFFFYYFSLLCGCTGLIMNIFAVLGALLLFGHLSVGNLSIISTFIN